MQPRMGGAAAPTHEPAGPVPSPSIPEPSRPGRKRLFWGLVLAVILLSAVWLWWRKQAADQAAQASLAKVTTRTQTVASGSVERTLRLTGVTAAENFVSLISPQLRGSRSGFGRSSRGGGSSDMPQQVQSSAGRGSSSGGSTPSVSTGSSGDSSSVASTSGSGRSGSTTFRAATSRSAQSTGVSRGSSSRSGSSSSAVMGDEGLGTTSSSLGAGTRGGGGPGGGGGGEFGLVLQEVAKAGSQIKKGDVVAEFDRQYMLTRLDDYRASVIQTEASFRKQRAQLEVTRKAHDQQVSAARGDVEKAKLDLKTTPVRSAIESERLSLALEEADARHAQLLSEVKYVDVSERSQIRTAEIELQQSKIELKRAEANADRMITKAPIDGLIVMQQTFRGGEFGQIQQGDQLFPGQPYMQIVDLRSMVINASVNQADVEALRIGQKARIRFDAYPDIELPAHIYSLGAMTKSGGFRGNFLKEIPLRLKLDKMDPRVIPDLSVSIDVIIEREDQAAAIAPLEAVFRDTPGGKPYAFVQTPRGWVKREVELGLGSHVVASVRAGLRPGEVVALSRPEAPESRENAKEEKQ